MYYASMHKGGTATVSLCIHNIIIFVNRGGDGGGRSCEIKTNFT